MVDRTERFVGVARADEQKACRAHRAGGDNRLACFLENDFIRIMILPELGGRVQMAYDKLKKRHFVYHNQVTGGYVKKH